MGWPTGTLQVVIIVSTSWTQGSVMMVQLNSLALTLTMEQVCDCEHVVVSGYWVSSPVRPLPTGRYGDPWVLPDPMGQWEPPMDGVPGQ